MASAGLSRNFKGLVRAKREGLQSAWSGTTASRLGVSSSDASLRTSDCCVEVTDLNDALAGIRKDSSGVAWEIAAKGALQQLFKKAGPVLEVRLGPGSSQDDAVEGSVRFPNGKAAEAAMLTAPQGFLPLNGREVRVRQPGSSKTIWRKFPPPRKGDHVDPDSKRRKLKEEKKARPNERFQPKGIRPKEGEEDESEAFWEAQRDQRGAPGALPPPPQPPPEPEKEISAPAPERPQPTRATADESEEDKICREGEEEVSVEMMGILEQPFSKQKKVLKKLRLKWHPDKNPERLDVATRVFQFIQSHEEWLAHHGLE